ncbi:hypothetical protein V8F20_007633 [Naviculisporaceae sp. PSN 640]
MGLFDGWFGSGSSSSSNKSDSDPLGKLDPKLREFLEKESPVRYTTASEEQAKLEDQQQRAKQQQQPQQKIPEASPSKNDQQQQEGQPKVPQESLYPDGRYAHLWKTYKPLASVEAENKTDHEKLMDVLDAYKDRKAKIGKTALENCADEQLDWAMCMKSGDVRARMTMCSAEVKKFEHCYNMQTRLLKAMGYLSAYRPAHVDEEIQMRADDLYRRQKQQEEEIAKAKEEGRPIPTFALITVPSTLPSPVSTTPTAASLPQKTTTPTPANGEIMEPDAETLESWRSKLEKEKLSDAERRAEMEALKGEYRAKQEIAAQVSKLKEETDRDREARKAQGKETMGDRLKSIFGN